MPRLTFPERENFGGRSTLELALSRIAHLSNSDPDLLALLDNLDLVIDDAMAVTCEAYPALSVVRTSTTLFDVIAAFGSAYTTIYQTYIADTPARGQVVEFDATVAACKLLRWATGEWVNEGTGDAWIPPQDTDIPSAAQLLLAHELGGEISTLFLLHEFAHIHAGASVHPSPDAEEAADAKAAEWFASAGLARTSTFGLAAAAAILAIRDLHRTRRSDTHPPGYERMLSLLRQHVSADEPWAFAVAILGLHLTERGIGPPKREFANFYETAVAYADILARAHAGKPSA